MATETDQVKPLADKIAEWRAQCSRFFFSQSDAHGALFELGNVQRALREACDEMERLGAQLDREHDLRRELVEALEPFARWANQSTESWWKKRDAPLRTVLTGPAAGRDDATVQSLHRVAAALDKTRRATDHKLGCDEAHQHSAPKCCDARCWCGGLDARAVLAKVRELEAKETK